jgi:hypothetical protein
MQTTAAQYAKQHGISISTARKQLNEMVEIGRAMVDYSVIIGNRSVKRGARSQCVAIRGNMYHIN